MATTIIPVSSKNGVVIVGTAESGAAEWSSNLAIENDRYKHFGMTPSAGLGSLTFSQVLTGFASGTGTIRALFDNTPGQRQPTDLNIYLDQTPTIFCGYTSLVGWLFVTTITAVRPSQNTGNPASSMYDFDFEITDIDFTITGP